MNDTIRIETTSEVEQFVAAVQSRLGDLGSEERDELLGGLEADLSDLVAERGPGALGDPAAYADELRAAAGLAAAPKRANRLQALDLGQLLDDAHRLGERVLDALPFDIGGLLRAVRPAWWVVRAWVASMLASMVIFGWYVTKNAWIPTPAVLPGLVVLVVAVAFSVQMGRGRFWPGGSRNPVARLVLVALNLTAFVALFPVVGDVVGRIQGTVWEETARAYRSSAGGIIAPDGREICNVHPFDAAGNPLTGVQLFDEYGRPIDARCRYLGQEPWMLGDVKRWNVFPQAKRAEDASVRGGFAEGSAIPTPQRANVPPVTPPTGVEVPTDGPTDGTTDGPTEDATEEAVPTPQSTSKSESGDPDKRRKKDEKLRRNN